MKFLKIIISVVKNWKVLLTLGSLLGFAYCGFVDQGYRADFSYYASTDGITEDTGYTSAEGGRVSESGGSSIGFASEADKEFIGQYIDPDEVLKQVVFVYTLIGICDQSSQKTVFKGCVSDCFPSSDQDTLDTCINDCKTASNSCDVLGLKSGSGFFYKTDKILTNRHVIEEIFEYTKNSKFYFSIFTLVENYEGTEGRVQTVAWKTNKNGENYMEDVALVELADDIDGAEPVELGKLNDVDFDDPVFTVGNPWDEKWILSLGERTKCNHRNPQDFEICTSADVYGGNSGGGLFDLKTGNIIGIIKQKVSGSASISGLRLRRFDPSGVGTHVDKIKDLIRGNGVSSGGQIPGNAQIQAHFESMSDNERRRSYRMIVNFIKDNLERRD